jgi:hypothetical protein
VIHLSLPLNRSFYRALSIAAPLCVSIAAIACGLSDGSVDVLSNDDASSSSFDATSDVVSSADVNVVVGDANPPALDSGVDADADADASFVPRYIFANTSTKAYALELHTNVLSALGSITACTDASINTFDLAQSSDGVLHALTWKTSGSFSFYAIEPDGGCIDVHGGPGSNPAGSSMWIGFQKGADADTLYSVVDNNGTLFSYNAMGDFIASVNGVFSGGGATADIACTPTLCYTALTHDRCSGSSDSNDCLVSFTNAGTNVTNVGDFGKAGIAGVAYDSGFIYGFATDGSIIKISITAPSTGAPFPITGTSTAGLVWAGAASSGAGE